MLNMETIALIFVGILVFLCIVYFLGSFAIRRRIRAGASLSDVKDEMEIRKSVFTIVGGASLLIGATYSFYEYRLKLRAEDRLLLSGALGQLIDVKSQQPEISAAALLQLDRLGASNAEERPALVQIVNGYLSERAKKPVQAHESGSARTDIQMAIYVLSHLLNGDPKLGELVLLRQVDLRHVRLESPKFVGVKFIDVDFGGANLGGADLSGSDLTHSSFKDSFLKGARVDGANLDFSQFGGAAVDEVNFCQVLSRKDVRLEDVQSMEGTKCITP
ncbi:pentapeptide repeat-containing protein [Rhizobium ruizarguesonis]|jgi:hypothetical protein|uniref:pentapeptide repeat-containing protein n=1 Tax=Rhizobium ruizarguesonis TaxID=2081791 RepID=UPI001032267C|nr:pentapeptide repeat-containing protein [Rhizobium ruizarguesonis]NEH32605.1 hypothetical protein [Rhizobium ruizarguesonis]NEI31727.1 hypothetical protein [Rhizobium ruizarguesonis]NEK12976.1 hypothetical protein [Rhizobium ruizarguesonis]TBB79489.1 pentapeptide repeat-containing protein [Rhizobium ruizarguesonis]TBD24993.1 pentapeptide repeat-containing protein [Rhizobium ruizarguesonis]